MKYTLITGDVVQGFECYGIFDSAHDAVSHASRDANLPDTWQVMPINPVEPIEDEARP